MVLTTSFEKELISVCCRHSSRVFCKPPACDSSCSNLVQHSFFCHHHLQQWWPPLHLLTIFRWFTVATGCGRISVQASLLKNSAYGSRIHFASNWEIKTKMAICKLLDTTNLTVHMQDDCTASPSNLTHFITLHQNTVVVDH
ncbi:uncharacterized protein LOC143025499 isoform X1 [Oratosquilla oratoria]|uniref:uncharacterized protein LOC143025499 isoform X1 n=1 Tax=Oratosquilla oratoria TaxID=337810 RepID=UPI003F768DCB